jgi:phage protein D
MRISADLAHQVTSTTLAGFDAGQGSAFVVTAEAGDLGPGRGRTGADVLNRALGARTEHVAHCPALNDTEAQAIADAAHNQRARGFVCLDGTVPGNPSIRVGSRIELSGVGPRFENTYQVTRVCHRYEQSQGYFTDFEATCAYVRGRI